jgi:hypothetical protein
LLKLKNEGIEASDMLPIKDDLKKVRLSMALIDIFFDLAKFFSI